MRTLTVIKKRTIDIRKFICVELYCDSSDDCESIRSMLAMKGVPFIEHRIDLDDVARTELVKRCSTQQVPQILINNHHVGGYDDLIKLDETRKLDVMLGLSSEYKQLNDQEQIRRVTIITGEH